MILARQNVDISSVLTAILEMHVFHSDVYFILSLICLEEIRKFEDSRGSNKLIKIDIIDVLDMRCLFAKVRAL